MELHNPGDFHAKAFFSAEHILSKIALAELVVYILMINHLVWVSCKKGGGGIIGNVNTGNWIK